MTGQEIDALTMSRTLVETALENPDVLAALEQVTNDGITLGDQFRCYLTEPAVKDLW